MEVIHTNEAALNEVSSYIRRHLTDINLLMVNLLKQLHNGYQSFVRELEKNTTLYGRLATVLDNMEAMRHQTEHMNE